jgi:hypothetical protein
MTLDFVQLLYYAAFALLGWYLRHKGFLTPGPVSPANQTILDLLKALLEKLEHVQVQAGTQNRDKATG